MSIPQKFNVGVKGKLIIAPPRGTMNNPIFDGSAITATRTYTLRDKSGIVVLQVAEFIVTRIPFVDANGNLVDNAKLAFDGTYLLIEALKISGLTSGRVPFIGEAGLITQDSAFLYDGLHLVIPGAIVSDLTPNKIISAGAAGVLESNYSVKTTIATPGTDTDIPTEKAVRDAIIAINSSISSLLTLDLAVVNQGDVITNDDEIVYIK